MGSRLARLIRPLNGALRRLGVPGQLVVVGDDWYNEDGLISAHNWNFVADVTYADAFEFSRTRSGLGSGPRWRTHVALWVAGNCVRVPGDFVELGVGRGWMSSAIIRSLPWDSMDKHFWLYDRFEDFDVDPVSGVQLASRNSKGTYSESLAETQRTFDRVPRVQLIAGSLPESLRLKPPGPVSFVHVDLNAAIPEAQSIEILWPHISLGGMILFDDFAYRGYEAQYSSTLELAQELGVSVLALPTGQGLIVKNS